MSQANSIWCLGRRAGSLIWPQFDDENYHDDDDEEEEDDDDDDKEDDEDFHYDEEEGDENTILFSDIGRVRLQCSNHH